MIDHLNQRRCYFLLLIHFLVAVEEYSLVKGSNLEVDDEARALADFAFDVYCTKHGGDQFLAYAQTQSSPCWICLSMFI